MNTMNTMNTLTFEQEEVFIELAEQDVHWQTVCASAKLEGVNLDAQNHILCGQHLAGNITFDQRLDAIISRYHRAPSMQ